MSAPSPVGGLTRAVSAENLRPAHVGREFVGIGVVREITFSAEGVTLRAEEWAVRVPSCARLHYWLRDSEIKRGRRAGASPSERGA